MKSSPSMMVANKEMWRSCWRYDGCWWLLIVTWLDLICMWRRGKRTSVSIWASGRATGLSTLLFVIISLLIQVTISITVPVMLAMEGFWQNRVIIGLLKVWKYEMEGFCNSRTVVLVGMHWAFASLQTGVGLKLLRWRKKGLKPFPPFCMSLAGSTSNLRD